MKEIKDGNGDTIFKKLENEIVALFSKCFCLLKTTIVICFFVFYLVQCLLSGVRERKTNISYSTITTEVYP